MTEIAQKQMEARTIELESMLCTKLYTAEEIRHIVKKRLDFESKINGPNKNKEDFREYILYEQTLLKDVRLRRDKYRVGEKKDAIEHRIIKRIRELYEMTIQYFPNDLLLFIQFFQFCRRVKYVNATNNIVTKMIQKHPNEEKVWYMAAGWYAYDCKDLTTAQKTILKGLSMHKQFQLLYKEGIEIELFYSFVKHKQKEDPKDEIEESTEETEKKRILSLEKIKVYLKFACLHINSCQFYIEILELFEMYNNTEQLQQVVIEHMLNKYSTNELLWQKLALREMKGLHYSTDSEYEYKEQSVKGQFLAAVHKFEQGVLKVPSEKKEKMWSLFLDFLLEQKSDKFGHSYPLILTSLKKAFEQASDEGYLNEKYFIQWLETANNDEEGMKITEKGINANPRSLFLWKARLQYLIMTGDDEAILGAFKKGREKLKEQSLPLWNALIRYNLLKLRNDEIELVFLNGIKEPEEISDSLKSQYVEWLATTKSLKAARQAYDSVAHKKPFSRKLHYTMAKLEMMDLDINIKNLRKVHQLAVEQFGNEDVDVWINYGQFCLDFMKVDLKESLEEIYKEAMKKLPMSLQDEFVDRFSSCKESIMAP